MTPYRELRLRTLGLVLLMAPLACHVPSTEEADLTENDIELASEDATADHGARRSIASFAFDVRNGEITLAASELGFRAQQLTPDDIEAVITSATFLPNQELALFASFENLSDQLEYFEVVFSDHPATSPGVTAEFPTLDPELRWYPGQPAGPYEFRVQHPGGTFQFYIQIFAEVDPVCPGVVGWPDVDGDGHGDPGALPMEFCDEDERDEEDHVQDPDDCDDLDPDVNPSADEVCGNAIDDDCDGGVDEDCSNDFCQASCTSQTVIPVCDGPPTGHIDNPPQPPGCLEVALTPNAACHPRLLDFASEVIQGSCSTMTPTNACDFVPAPPSMCVAANASRSLDGFGGTDALHGGSASDYLAGGNGDDYEHGHLAGDVIFGGSGVDRIEGGRGNDELHDDQGDDHIYGGLDDDTLFDGPGDDTYWWHKRVFAPECGGPGGPGGPGPGGPVPDDGSDTLSRDSRYSQFGNNRLALIGVAADEYCLQESADEIIVHMCDGSSAITIRDGAISCIEPDAQPSNEI